jgi:hypothetical protein
MAFTAVRAVGRAALSGQVKPVVIFKGVYAAQRPSTSSGSARFRPPASTVTWLCSPALCLAGAELYRDERDADKEEVTDNEIGPPQGFPSRKGFGSRG